MTGTSPSPFEFAFPPEPEQVRMLRQSLRDKLAEFGASEDTTDNVVLVADELVSNSIEHAKAYRSSQTLLRVRLHCSGETVLFEFVDPDVPDHMVHDLARALVDAAAQAMPSIDAERGRGMYLVAHNVEDLEVVIRPEGGMRLQGRFD